MAIPRQESSSDPPFSAGAGCFIMITAVVILGGVAVFFVVQGFRINREIGKFTDPAPVTRTIEAPSPEMSAELQGRLDAFAAEALAGGESRLELTAADLNHLIATDLLLADFMGNTRVTEITGDFLIAEMSQPLNSLKPGQLRYLNAVFRFQPRRLDDGTWFLALVDITKPGEDIPRGFIDLYSQRKLFQLDPENERLGPVLETIRDIAVMEGKIVVSSGKDDPDSKR